MYMPPRFCVEACQFLLIPLWSWYESLVYGSPGSLGPGVLLWVGPCPELELVSLGHPCPLLMITHA